jgi:hypothetical protein
MQVPAGLTPCQDVARCEELYTLLRDLSISRRFLFPFFKSTVGRTGVRSRHAALSVHVLHWTGTQLFLVFC